MAFQLFTCRRPVAEEALPTVRLRERCAVRRGALPTIVPAVPRAGCGPYLASVLREALKNTKIHVNRKLGGTGMDERFEQVLAESRRQVRELAQCHDEVSALRSSS